MGKKGLSYAEKRDRMLNYFHETKEAYNFKEIEKFSVKLGLPLPTVKEILDHLVADDLVLCEKIGAGNFYWSFPSQTYQSMLNKIDTMKEEKTKLETETEELTEKISQKKVGKEDSEERSKLMQAIGELKGQIDKLQKELTAAQRFDPARVEEMKKSNVQFREQANEKTGRRTFSLDELYLARKWVLDKCGMDKETFAKQFGVPVELEYLE